jgi:aryl-alcohol dehydrogenase-like predicted oxidoreductase
VRAVTSPLRAAAHALPRRYVHSLDREVSVVGAGCWSLGGPTTNDGQNVGWAPVDAATADRVLQHAWLRGITLYDTADVYGHGLSERRLGRLVRQVPRNQIVLVSKVGYTRHGDLPHPYHPTAMRRQLESSLSRLGTDHLDVYAYHNDDFGPKGRHLETALATMRRFQDEGLVRATSMRAPHEFILDETDPPHRRAQSIRAFLDRLEVLRPDFVTARHNYLSPRPGPGQFGLAQFAADRGITILAKQVLAQGLLTLTGDPSGGPAYGEGDHRAGKREFRPAVRRLCAVHLDRLRIRLGITTEQLASLAVRYAAQMLPDAIILIGLHTPTQLSQCLSDLSPLPDDTVDALHETGDAIRQVLHQQNDQGTR